LIINQAPYLRLKMDMRPMLASLGYRYGWALAIFSIATGVRVLVAESWGPPAFVIPLVATLVASWIGGVGPCLLVQTLTLVVEAKWFPRPPSEVSPSLVHRYAGMVAYYVVGLSVAVLSEIAGSAKRRARANAAALRTRQEQLRGTLACMADGVVVTDANGRIVLMNPLAEQLTGWKAEAALGGQATAILALDRGNGPHFVWQVLTSGATLPQVQDDSLRTRRGEIVPISYSAAPLRDPAGAVEGAVVVFRDDSERRRQQQNLLEDAQRKDEFLATLAHELRNPLAPLRTGLDLLKMPEAKPEMQAEVRAMMERQVMHLSRLVDDLLDVSRITRGKLRIQKSRVNVADLVREAADIAMPMMRAAGHGFEQQVEPAMLFVDPHRLTQVLSNLLSNAAKYTTPPGRISICAAVENGEVAIRVRDNGIGIPDDMRERIFDVFTQLDRSIDSRHTGLGIGLTLVKRLVEMHGGSVVVISNQPEPGSTFCVRLPLAESIANDSAPADERNYLTALPKPAGRKVLIVDDNPDALESLRMLISQLGHEVEIGRDGLEALAAVKRFQPEVVVMDLGMPRLNGYDAARAMRSESGGERLLLIATSGWGNEEAQQRSRESGFNHHLVKPIEPAKLHELIQGYPRTTKAAAPVQGGTV
jgi:PAS domain S-box-containing protein